MRRNTIEVELQKLLDVCDMKRCNKKKVKKKKIDVLKDCSYMWLDEALRH